jgi:hypothetical protein
MPSRATAPGLRLLAVAALLLLPARARAQLPAAADLMAAHNRAIGGEAAVAALPAVHMSGSFATPGGPATVEVWAARPDRMYSVLTIPGMGEIRQGYDGTTAWRIYPMRGAAILEGEELAQTRDEATVDNVLGLRLPGAYRSVETVEKATIEGQECYRVKLVSPGGRETGLCFALADGLAMAAFQPGPGGEMVMLLQGYTEYGGVKVPTRMVSRMADQEQVFTIAKVEPIAADPARFELPPEIKALVKK